MTHADLTFAQWNDRPDDTARRLAQEIAGRHDLTLVGFTDTVHANRSHRTALFDRDGMRFALVPGGRPTLGYDGSRFRPAPEQVDSYAESASEFGLPPLAEYVDAMTSPERSVEIPAMLVAVDAFDPCEISPTPDDPRMRYDQALAGLADLGLRTTTPDEWEWACGAGAATLFRWGDESPDDGYPFDYETGPHRETNLWGLAIAQDPYRHEVTTERTVVCGGDGGSTTCGGSGFFLGWLTLATAYRDRDFGEWLASADGYADEILTRPVIELT
ncbi:hypothetical protein [Micromonospora sp. NBS 11-29]|uniref:hypothetical protein n=1 Tax=Micromonospora sp. NBS 11-29 TaxID=1960879 RepID=UPI000B7816EF|nr:hypothetical protein [Micromonospora sp. NBS 11-29]